MDFKDIVKRRVALIGLGRIAKAFLEMRNAEDSAHWEVVGVLRRKAEAAPGLGFPIVDTLADMRKLKVDLLIDFTGPSALKSYGAELLRISDVWTVGGAALASLELEQSLRDVSRVTGHRLRVLPGAIGGLDAVSAMAIDAACTIRLVAGTTNNPDGSGSANTARSVVSANTGVNVLAAAALAAHGLDKTLVDHIPMEEGGQRRFTIIARGPYASFTASIDPVLDSRRGTMIVAASAMAALRNDYRSIWVG